MHATFHQKVLNLPHFTTILLFIDLQYFLVSYQTKFAPNPFIFSPKHNYLYKPPYKQRSPSRASYQKNPKQTLSNLKGLSRATQLPPPFIPLIRLVPLRARPEDSPRLRFIRRGSENTQPNRIHNKQSANAGSGTFRDHSDDISKINPSRPDQNAAPFWRPHDEARVRVYIGCTMEDCARVTGVPNLNDGVVRRTTCVV